MFQYCAAGWQEPRFSVSGAGQLRCAAGSPLETGSVVGALRRLLDGWPVKPNTTPLLQQDEPLPDVKYLRFLDTLYRTRRLSRTAELLGQSAPTMSIWLAALREQLHDALFVRTPGGMQPTPRTEALIPLVRTALASLRGIVAGPEAFDPETAQRQFRLCMTDGSMLTLLPRILAHLRLRAPQVKLKAIKISARTPRLLENGDADLALGFVPTLATGFYQQALFDQVWVCLVNPDHPVISKRLDLATYAQARHIEIPEGTGHAMLADALARHQIARQVALEIPVYLGMPAIISCSDLIATVPSLTGHTLARRSGLSIYPCPVPVPAFTVMQYWHERVHLDAGHRWFRQVIHEVCADRTRTPAAP